MKVETNSDFHSASFVKKMKLLGIIILDLLLVANLGAQDSLRSDLSSQNRQNQQRAFALSVLKPDLAALEDAPLKCSFRLQIAKFIFEKKVTNYFEVANNFVADCLEDVDKNSNQFSESETAFWRSHLISLLRVNSPEIAPKFEEKHLKPNQDNNLSNFQELSLSKDSATIVNRLISEIQKGKVSPDIIFIVTTLQQENSEASARLLEALLPFFENTTKINDFALVLNALSSYYISKSTPLELRKRFLLFAIRLGQKALLEQANSRLAEFSRNILRLSLPKIEETIPSHYPQALAIFSTLDSKLANENREKEEAYRRIRESKDKLQQTIVEAEAAENEALKEEFWRKAADIALQRKKTRLAVDLIMKIESDGELFQEWRNQFLKDEILSVGLKEKDFESAEYVIRHLQIPKERGDALLKVASKYLELKATQESSEKLDEALKAVEKAEAEVSKIEIMFRAVPIAIKLDKLKAFEIANSAVNIANKIPTPTLDDKLGTEGRKKYVSGILFPIAAGFSQAFEVLAETDTILADTLVSGIRLKEWRLAVQIAVEKHRKYPIEKIKKSAEQ